MCVSTHNTGEARVVGVLGECVVYTKTGLCYSVAMRAF